MIVLFKADLVAVLLASDEDLTAARRVVEVAVAEKRGSVNALAVLDENLPVGDAV